MKDMTTTVRQAEDRRRWRWKEDGQNWVHQPHLTGHGYDDDDDVYV